MPGTDGCSSKSQAHLSVPEHSKPDLVTDSGSHGGLAGWLCCITGVGTQALGAAFLGAKDRGASFYARHPPSPLPFGGRVNPD